MWHVLRQDPKKMHEWTFPVSSVKNVSQCRRNAKALFLYVYENSDDFHIFFPSEIHKQRFYDMVLDMLNRYEEENHIGRIISVDTEVRKTAIRVKTRDILYVLFVLLILFVFFVILLWLKEILAHCAFRTCSLTQTVLILTFKKI